MILIPVKCTWFYTHDFVIADDGLLYCIDLPGRRTRSRVRTHLRLCVPRTMRQSVMAAVHGSKLSGHPGIKRMIDKLIEDIWWPTIRQDVVRFISACRLCQAAKQRRMKIPTQPSNIPSGPWSQIAVDYTGPLPLTSRGNQYILVIVDKFTRYAVAIATEDMTSETTATHLLSRIICEHGLPEYIQSDRGNSFVSQLSASIYQALGIKQIKTTAYHPQSNGVVEIFNKILKTTLRLWANENADEWDLLLPYAVFAYNTAYHQIIQEMPFYLQYGREPRLLTHLITGQRPEHSPDQHAYAVELSQRLYDVHTRVRDIYQKVNEEREENELNESIVSYEIGSKVVLFDPSTPPGKSRKLVQRWKGPYTVLRKLSPVVYEIARDGDSQKVNVHRLRPLAQDEDSILERCAADAILAEEELSAIDDSMQRLVERNTILQHQSQAIADVAMVEQSSQDQSRPISVLVLCHTFTKLSWNDECTDDYDC